MFRVGAGRGDCHGRKRPRNDRGCDEVQSRNDTERGSDASAAGGRESELSEWQRSTDAKALRRRRQMSGTATGQGSNE